MVLKTESSSAKMCKALPFVNQQRTGKSIYQSQKKPVLPIEHNVNSIVTLNRLPGDLLLAHPMSCIRDPNFDQVMSKGLGPSKDICWANVLEAS